MHELEKRKELTGLFTFFSANYPQYEIEIDNELAMQKGVTIGNAMNTLSIFIGSTYELGFIKYQRFFKVFVQAAPKMINTTKRAFYKCGKFRPHPEALPPL